MDVVKSIRVCPEVQAPKRNNFTEDGRSGRYIIQRMKHLIVFQALLGINRLRLNGYRKCFLYLSYIYCAVLVLSAVTFVIVIESNTTNPVLLKNTVAVEYLFLAFGAMYLQGKINIFFSMIQSFDERLNICDEINLTSPIRYSVIGITATIIYGALEQIIYIVWAIYKYGATYSMFIACLGLMVHDMEMMFLCVLLLMVYRRLRVINSHVARVFPMNVYIRRSKEDNKLEALSKKIDLDVSSVHKAYDLLHKCSEQLNSIMNVPVTIMLTGSGFATIIMLKSLIDLIQSENKRNSNDSSAINAVIVINIGRCLKYIAFLICPCYMSNVTKNQVDEIRTITHDVLNTNQLDKAERRKVKAFRQLCYDKTFSYRLWGALLLDMSLPLSFCSLCTAYLLIVIQFSKFIG